ncbi:MAG: RC-LH1 core complex protein PufX [Pseudomonadota bacterium]
MSKTKSGASIFPDEGDVPRALQREITYQMLRGALYGAIAIIAVVVFIYFWRAVALILPEDPYALAPLGTIIETAQASGVLATLGA